MKKPPKNKDVKDFVPKQPKHVEGAPKPPGSCRRRPFIPPDENSIRMMKQWQDSEYRESVRDRMRKLWADPDYRRRRGAPQATTRLTTAQRLRKQAADCREAAKKWLDYADTLEAKAGDMEREEFENSGAVLYGDTLTHVGTDEAYQQTKIE